MSEVTFSATSTMSNPDEMHNFGVRLGKQLHAGDLVVLTGELGAGKTTLSRGIGEGLQVRGPVTSPTFVLARTHPSLVSGAPLVHVDAYRLSDAQELDDLDIDFEHSVVLVEWGVGMVDTGDSWLEIVIDRPVGASPALHEHTTADVSGNDDDDANSAELIEPRTLHITGYGDRWRQGVN